MVLSITPGYDFGVHEVPTRETLLRQARNMRVSGIGLDQIDASLVGIKSGTSSGTTSASLPSPGWMWADPGGSLWVETDHGAVKLKRAGGGFESVRWAQSYAPEVSPVHPGSPYNSTPADVNQTEGVNLEAGASESVSMWDALFNNSDNGALSQSLMFNAETMASGVTYPRLVGRGITVMHVNGTQSHYDFCLRRPSGVRVLSTTNAWSGGFVSSDSNTILGANKEHWYGIFISPHSGTSLAPAAGTAAMHGTASGWKYDQSVWGPGASI